MNQDVVDTIVSYINDDNEGYIYNKLTGKMYKVREINCVRTKEDRIRPKSLTFHGKQRQSTHIMFYLIEGRFPDEDKLVDHKDRDTENNEWTNLREATHAQNMYNKGLPGRYVNNHLPFERGVSKIGNRFRVQINSTAFGAYDTIEEANAIARKMRRELQGEFACRDEIVRRV